MIIKCKDLIKIYKDEEKKFNVPALRGCDFDVKEGELVSIIGPSGSGKTTLVNILAGLNSPSSGIVEVAGYHLEQMKPNSLNIFRLVKIGLIDQFPERTLLLNVTVDDNMDFTRSLLNKKTMKSQSSNQEILEMLGISHLCKRVVATLSGGEMTRVALACALAKNVPILLCDEPTGQLDSGNTEKVRETLRKITLNIGTTIVVVTHDVQFLEGVDRTYEIRDGRLSSVLTAEERVIIGQQPKFPLNFKGHIDSTRTIRVPDLVFKTLKLSDVGEFSLKKTGEVDFRNPDGLTPEKIFLKEVKERRKILTVKPLPEDYDKGKNPIIKLKGIFKIYPTEGGALDALSDINLTIFEKEIVFIVGPSGSGKTTLIKLISGMVPITKGSLKILGKDFAKLSDKDRAIMRRDHMGLVAQQGSLNPYLRVDENLFLKEIYRGTKIVDDDEFEEKRKKLLFDFQITHRQNAYPLEISGGELQRASLAIAMNDIPQILLLDEPTANLDSELAEQTITLLFAKCTEMGITTIISTHDINLLRKGLRVIELMDGKIYRSGIVS